VIEFLESNLEETTSDSYREWLAQYMSPVPCKTCQTRRLRPESLAVKVGGLSIADFTALPLDKARARRTRRWGTECAAKTNCGTAARGSGRAAGFSAERGTGLLDAGRSPATLSGGEAQRIRLATQIGSRLRECCTYSMSRRLDCTRATMAGCWARWRPCVIWETQCWWWSTMKETIRRANYVLDLGPGAGKLGGYLVAAGRPAEIAANPASLTGQYLAGTVSIPVPATRRSSNGKAVTVLGATANNLKNVDVSFPLGMLTVVTGVSGSGKSTLVNDILYRALAQELYDSTEKPEAHRAITGLEYIDKVVQIDQAPIGRNAAVESGHLFGCVLADSRPIRPCCPKRGSAVTGRALQLQREGAGDAKPARATDCGASR